MDIEITSAKLLGNPDSSGWVQAYEYIPEDIEKARASGKLFALISTSSYDKEDVVYSGREILSRLHEEYFGKVEGSPYERIKNAISRVAEEFSSWDEIEICSISFVGEVIYLASLGGSSIFLFRNGELHELLKSEGGGVVSASGYARSGDILVIGSKNFFYRFAKGVIKSALMEKVPEKAVEALAPAVYSGDKVGSIGAYFLKIGGEKTRSEDVSGYELAREESSDYHDKSLSFTKASREKFSGVLNIFNKLKEKSVYLKTGIDSQEFKSPQRKIMASVGVLLLLLLLVSIFFGIYQNRKNKEKEIYEGKIASAEHELEEAEDLFTLHPERARELFHEARGKVLSLTDEGYSDEEKVRFLLDEIKRKENEILREYREEENLFVDLSLLSQGFEGKDMLYSNGKIYIFDNNSKRLISVEVSSKRAEIALGPQDLDKAQKIAIYSDRMFGLNEDGIVEIRENRKVIEKDWSGEVLINTFAGNIYLLEKEKSDISRYFGLEAGFSGRKSWLSEGTTPNLTNAKEILIDGSIWVLKEDGKIIKLAYGNPQNFVIEGVNPQVTEIQSIFTHEETEGIYLLDKENERVVVLDKEGKYIAQYYSEAVKDAKSLVVSETERKIILLTGDKLYALDVKHII